MTPTPLQICLESPFWAELQAMAAAQALSVDTVASQLLENCIGGIWLPPLRPKHLETLHRMHRIRCANEPLCNLVQEIVESECADFLLAELPDTSVLGGPLISSPRKGRSKISAADREAIRRLHREGTSASQLAARYKITAVSVRRYCRQDEEEEEL